MIYNKVSQDAFLYIGTTQDKPELSDNAKKGQIYYDNSSERWFIFDGENWEESLLLGRTRRVFRNGRWEWIAEGDPADVPSVGTRLAPNIFDGKRQEITNCLNCGAPYEGKERCEYCGTYLG